MSLQKPSLFKTWLIAIRPFSLPASTMPVVFGTVLGIAIERVPMNIPLFLLCLVSMVSLHSGANILSDVNDFKRGIDKEPTPASGALVRGYMNVKTARKGAFILFAFGSVLGIIIVYYIGLPILIIGVIGITIGVFYTVKPFSLKYNALGDFAVFLDFGILGSLGAYTVQTGNISWVPAVWAIPMSLLVIGILHANNWRDIQSDEKHNFSTVAALLGERGSLIYYVFLILGAYGTILVLIVITRVLPGIAPSMPFTFFITLGSIPVAIRLIRKAATHSKPENTPYFLTLDAETAKLNLIFGLLCTASLLLHMLIRNVL